MLSALPLPSGAGKSEAQMGGMEESRTGGGRRCNGMERLWKEFRSSGNSMKPLYVLRLLQVDFALLRDHLYPFSSCSHTKNGNSVCSGDR